LLAVLRRDALRHAMGDEGAAAAARSQAGVEVIDLEAAG